MQRVEIGVPNHRKIVLGLSQEREDWDNVDNLLCAEMTFNLKSQSKLFEVASRPVTLSNVMHASCRICFVDFLVFRLWIYIERHTQTRLDFNPFQSTYIVSSHLGTGCRGEHDPATLIFYDSGGREYRRKRDKR